MEENAKQFEKNPQIETAVIRTRRPISIKGTGISDLNPSMFPIEVNLRVTWIAFLLKGRVIGNYLRGLKQIKGKVSIICTLKFP